MINCTHGFANPEPLTCIEFEFAFIVIPPHSWSDLRGNFTLADVQTSNELNRRQFSTAARLIHALLGVHTRGGGARCAS
jgi:hypothetical protein